MKKVFFSFAVAAVSVCMMAACGNKSQQNAEAAEGAEGEATEQAEAVKGIAVDNEKFSVVYPEVWQPMGEVNQKYPELKRTFDDGTYVLLRFNAVHSSAFAELEDYVKNQASDTVEPKQQLDPITIGDYTFLVVLNPAHGAYGDTYGLYAAKPDVKNDFIWVKIQNSKDGKVTPENEEVQAAIKTLKLK